MSRRLNSECFPKISRKQPKWDFEANHGRIGADDYTGCEMLYLQHPELRAGSTCPDCAACNSKGILAVEDKPQFLLRLEGTPMITGTKYALEITRCNLCRTRFYTKAPEVIAQAPKYDASCISTLAIARYSMGVPMSRLEAHQAMQVLSKIFHAVKAVLFCSVVKLQVHKTASKQGSVPCVPSVLF